MPLLKLMAAVAIPATLLAATVGGVRAQVPGDFDAARQEANRYELGVRIATLLQKFDEPTSFQAQSAVGFRTYRGSGTSYFYANARYACRVDIGYTYVFPDYHGENTEGIECCTTVAPFFCDRYPGQRHIPGADE